MKTINSSCSLIVSNNSKIILDKLACFNNHRNKPSSYLLYQRALRKGKVNCTTTIKSQNMTSAISQIVKQNEINRNISYKVNEVENSYFSTLNDDKEEMINSQLNSDLEQLAKIKENDMNKVNDIRFDIVKKSLNNYAKIISNDKGRKYIEKIIDTLSAIYKFKNEQIGELTTNNSSMDNHLFAFNKKNSYKETNSKIAKMSNKTTVENNIEKSDFSSENSDELESIQFSDKNHLQKHRSMTNINLPKLDLNFEKIYTINNTRNNNNITKIINNRKNRNVKNKKVFYFKNL